MSYSLRLLAIFALLSHIFLLSGCNGDSSGAANPDSNSGSPMILDVDAVSDYSHDLGDSTVPDNNPSRIPETSLTINPTVNMIRTESDLSDTLMPSLPEPHANGLRSLFCSFPHNFQRGRYLKTSKYGPIGQVQDKLGLEIDGIMGKQTIASINDYKRKLGFEADNCLDVQTWQTMFPDRPIPTQLERAISLTFFMEGTDYDQIERNYGTADKSGMTWGPLGMTLASGEIQTILKNIKSKHSRLSDDLTSSEVTMFDRLAKANLSSGDSLNFKSLKALISKLAGLDYVRKEYDIEAYRSVNNRFKYYENFLKEMGKNTVVTELDWAMFWDVATQTGYAQKKSNAVRSTISVNISNLTLDERRRRMGDVIADMVAARWKQDRTLRNSAFYGENSFVGKAYGFDERPIFQSISEKAPILVDQTSEDKLPSMDEVAF